MRLDVGSGPFPRPGFRTVDRFVEGADFRADMWALPVPDGSVEVLFSSHALEHVPRARVAPTLAEWRRVLRPDGRVELEVPDLAYACRFFLKHAGTPDDVGFPLQVLFGNQAHEGEFHMTGWTERSLRADLVAAGLRVVELTAGVWSHEQECLRAVAVRA